MRFALRRKDKRVHFWGRLDNVQRSYNNFIFMLISRWRYDPELTLTYGAVQAGTLIKGGTKIHILVLTGQCTVELKKTSFSQT